MFGNNVTCVTLQWSAIKKLQPLIVALKRTLETNSVKGQIISQKSKLAGIHLKESVEFYVTARDARRH